MPLLAALGLSWAALGRPWGTLGHSWAALGELLVPSWPLLGAPGRSGYNHGTLLVALGALLAVLVALLGRPGSLLAALGPFLWLPRRSWGTPRGWRAKETSYYTAPRPRDPCPFMYNVYIYILELSYRFKV